MWQWLRRLTLRRKHDQAQQERLRLDTSKFRWRAITHTRQVPRDGRPGRTVTRVELYSPQRHRMRFLFDVGGQHRAFLWAQIASDGSLMFAPRQDGMAMYGVAQATDGRVRIDPRGSTPVTIPDKMGRKVSVHASGTVKAFGEFSWRGSLRSISKQERLAVIAFAHPIHFDVVPEPEAGDYLVPGPDEPAASPLPFHLQADGQGGLEIGPVVVSYPLQEFRPLRAAVYVAPLGKQEAPVEDDMSEHMTILEMPVTGLKNCHDLTFQWVFGHGLDAKWPEQSAVLWAASRTRPEEPPSEQPRP